MLKKIFLAAVMLLALNSAAFASSDVKIFNNTGKTITQIYLSPTDAPQWILQNVNFLREGESCTLVINAAQFQPRQQLRYFDIGVNYDDFTQQIWSGLDILNLSAVVLQPQGREVLFR